MKHKLILSLMLASNLASAGNKTIPSKPNRVTVYLQGAQIYHNEDVNIPAGTTDFAFQGVSPYMDMNTVMASGKGDFMILETRFNTRYPETIRANEVNPLQSKYERQIELKNDSIQEIGYALHLCDSRKKNLVTEKNFLEGNRLLKGETKRDTLALVINAIEYYRSRMINIDQEYMKAVREEDKLNRLKDQIRTRLNEVAELVSKIQNGVPLENSQPIYEVIVSVSADAALIGSIQFNYYTPQAWWTPEYDLKANSTSTAIQLVQKAKVHQNTMIDWKNVQMTLSTGNPIMSNTRPFLSAFYMGYYRPISLQNVEAVAIGRTDQTEMDVETFAPKMPTSKAMVDDAKFVSNITTIVNSPVLVEYKIEANYTIPADNKPHVVAIQKKDLDTRFEYYAVPKLDKDAFLQAKLTNWEELNLMSGEAKIYFDGSFVGKSAINPGITSDTLALDLGRDKSIVIERSKLKDKTKEQLLGDNKVITKAYSIVVRNTKNVAITINVQDQIPLSSQKEIVIENESIDGASKDELTGILTWGLNLKPKESKTIKFSYTVKYPKTVVLSGMP